MSTVRCRHAHSDWQNTDSFYILWNI